MGKGAARCSHSNFVDNNGRLRGAGSGTSCVCDGNRRQDTPAKKDTPKPERHVLYATDPSTKKAHENPWSFKPDHSKCTFNMLVRSYLTGGKPSGENRSHAHGYQELMPKQGATLSDYSLLLLMQAVHFSRGNRVRAGRTREDVTDVTGATRDERRWSWLAPKTVHDRSDGQTILVPLRDQ